MKKRVRGNNKVVVQSFGGKLMKGFINSKVINLSSIIKTWIQ